MLKQTIKKWNQSIEQYENGSVGEALKILTSVEQGTSKINYNIGVMYIKSNNFRNAIEYFNRSIEQDKYLASSYFMRGISRHMNGELNHAIVDYDETISKLRGHEYIDYKQLGLDHKLLLAEVLFNKALALGRAGSSVALQATQCISQPSDSQEFRNQCKKIQDGSQLNFSTRPIPLTLLFKPPKVSDGPQKQRSATTSSIQPSSSSAATTPMSSSPPSYILKGPTVSTPSSTPPSTPSPKLPSTPPTPISSSPKPSFGGSSASPPSSIKSMSPIISINKALPPKPPPLPSKKLPSRPISCVIQDVKITLKVFYSDRRLIQIPVPCNLSTFKQKIELKFEISISDKFSISFQLDGEEIEIDSQVQLDKMICMEIKEINIRDVVPSSSSSSDNSYSNNNNTSSYSSSYDNKPKSSFSIPKSTTPNTRPVLAPTTTTSNNFNRNATLPKKFGSPQSSSGISNVGNSSGGPPIPTRTSPSISLLKQQQQPNQSPSINIPPKVPTSSRPKMTQSHSPPSSSYSLSSYSTSFQSTSSPSLSSSYNGSSNSGFNPSRTSPTPYPYQVLYTDDNEKYYLNTETNQTYWELPQ
ncbi:hypothetical protein RB653_008823 [Dictyostelium firmibasis]|uniref:NOX activator n=1 Tax=Dictyostelium firmibasis TaxID=79012 RepID=A0AAN7TT57_9MYCE